MQTSLVLLENLLQALTAGLLIGSVYALMCVGLGFIFGVMRVINFAQGEFLMLGMYATLYCVHLARPRPDPRAVRRADRRRGDRRVPALRRRHPAAPLLPRAGDRGPGVRHRGRGALPAADPDARPVAHHRQRRPHLLRLDAGEHPHAALGDRVGDRPARRRPRLDVLQQGAQRGVRRVDRGRARALLLRHPLADRQAAARRGRQPRGGDLHGHRRRPGAPHRVRPRLRDHRARRRAGRDLLPVPAVRRPRVRHHHVRRRRARRHGQHRRRVLGRADDRARAAALDAVPAGPAAERGDLRRVPADRPAGAPRACSGGTWSAHDATPAASRSRRSSGSRRRISRSASSSATSTTS